MKERKFISAIEAAKYINEDVSYIHSLIEKGIIIAKKSPSGKYRLAVSELDKIDNKVNKTIIIEKKSDFYINNTKQTMFCGDARNMKEIKDNSIHLMITSPPYFNTKMYSKDIKGDLGNIHDLDEWFSEIENVWREVYRVLQWGRKAFINIMNLPISEKNSFRTLNLTGKTIEVFEKIGFIFKRDIIWQKTNGVRAHFGTYPYPGGILLNNMHEFILEFQKPDKKGYAKYGHLTEKNKEDSKLDKEFWLKLKNSDVWLMKPEGSGDNREHISQFPYELPYRLIKAYSFISETILDPFAGSFTTLKVSADLVRNGVGYEINPNFILIAKKKFSKYQKRLI